MPCLTRKCLVLTVCLLTVACAHQRPSPGNPPPAGFLTGEGEAAYHAFIAELALQREDLATAADQYLQAAHRSDDPKIAERAAAVAFAAEEYELAQAAASLWLERMPDNADAHRMLVSLAVRNARPEAAVSHLEFLLANGPDDRADAWLLLMFLLAQEPPGDDALAALQLLLAQHPGEAEGHYAVAALALETGSPEVAREAARLAYELAPDWSRAGLLLARAEIEAGDKEAGIATARTVVAASDDDQVKLEFAGLLVDSGYLEEARTTLDALLDKRPDMPDALFAAGLLEMRAERLEQARVHFTNLLGTGQRRLDALFFLASVAEQLGESSNALQLYLRIRSGRHFPAAQNPGGQAAFSARPT